MNIMSGTKLAVFQDKLIAKLLEQKNTGGKLDISSKDIKQLNETNLWVKAANKLAPNNLGLRHLILQDLICNKKNIEGVQSLLKKLVVTNNSNISLWAEGYSYWLYVKDVLKLYAAKYTQLETIVSEIDLGFAVFSFEVDGKFYPPFYGDCRFVQLDKDGVYFIMSIKYVIRKMISHPLVTKNKDVYVFHEYNLGGNTHTQKEEEMLYTGNEEFKSKKFYEGYDKKYSSKTEEFTDVLKRIFKKGD
jgi:hypothetical protein